MHARGVRLARGFGMEDLSSGLGDRGRYLFQGIAYMSKFTLSEATDIVAHYTSLETCCNHILPSGKMRFSPLGTTNDPYEFKKRLGNYSVNGDTSIARRPNVPEFDAVDEEYCKIVLNHFKVMCVTGSTHSQSDLKTKCYMHPRMWAQYGDEHRGVALIFNRSKLDNVVQKLPLETRSGDVTYVDEFELDDSNLVGIRAPQDCTGDIYRHLETFSNTIFFTKHADWESEDERRYVCIDRNETGFEFVKYGDALIAVVMGINADSAKYLPRIRNLTHNCPVFQCGWATRGELFVYRHHPDSKGGVVIENFHDGYGTEVEIQSWPADDR